MFAYNNVKGFTVLYHPQFSPASDTASQDRSMDGLGGAIEIYGPDGMPHSNETTQPRLILASNNPGIPYPNYPENIPTTSAIPQKPWNVHIWPQQAPVHTRPSSYKSMPENGPPYATWAFPMDCRSQLVSTAESSSPTMLSPDRPAKITGDNLNAIHIPDSSLGNDGMDEVDTTSMQIASINFGRWRCEICDKEFRRKQRAAQHFQNKHQGVRLRCDGSCGKMICRKSFASQESLDVHLNPLRVNCEICKRSLLKKNISRHQREHCRNS